MNQETIAKNVNVRLNLIIKILEKVINRLKEINIEKKLLEHKILKPVMPSAFIAKKIALLDIELTDLQAKVNNAKKEVIMLKMLRELQIDVESSQINETNFKPL